MPKVSEAVLRAQRRTTPTRPRPPARDFRRDGCSAKEEEEPYSCTVTTTTQAMRPSRRKSQGGFAGEAAGGDTVLVVELAAAAAEPRVAFEGDELVALLTAQSGDLGRLERDHFSGRRIDRCERIRLEIGH